MRDRPALRNEIINNNDRARCGSRSFNWLLDFNRTLPRCAAPHVQGERKYEAGFPDNFFRVPTEANRLFKSDFPPWERNLELCEITRWKV